MISLLQIDRFTIQVLSESFLIEEELWPEQLIVDEKSLWREI